MICKSQKRYTRLAAASDKVYQLLAHGRWFSPGSRASSTTETGSRDIAKILLKVNYITHRVIRALCTLIGCVFVLLQHEIIQ
jgi:hypothetical protein